MRLITRRCTPSVTNIMHPHPHPHPHHPDWTGRQASGSSRRDLTTSIYTITPQPPQQCVRAAPSLWGHDTPRDASLVQHRIGAWGFELSPGVLHSCCAWVLAISSNNQRRSWQASTQARWGHKRHPICLPRLRVRRNTTTAAVFTSHGHLASHTLLRFKVPRKATHSPVSARRNFSMTRTMATDDRRLQQQQPRIRRYASTQPGRDE